MWRSKALKLAWFCHEAGKKQPTSLMQLVFLVFRAAIQPYNKIMVGVGWTLDCTQPLNLCQMPCLPREESDRSGNYLHHSCGSLSEISESLTVATFSDVFVDS